MKAEDIKVLEEAKDKDAINQRLQAKDVRKRERRLLNRVLNRLKPKRKPRVKKDKVVREDSEGEDMIQRTLDNY